MPGSCNKEEKRIALQRHLITPARTLLDARLTVPLRLLYGLP